MSALHLEAARILQPPNSVILTTPYDIEVEDRSPHWSALARDHFLSVEDNGIGLDPKNFSRLFSMFQRLNTSQAYPGTGIGLAIVRKAVERMGGTVSIDSELCQGSRFSVELAAAQVTTAPVLQTAPTFQPALVET